VKTIIQDYFQTSFFFWGGEEESLKQTSQVVRLSSGKTTKGTTDLSSCNNVNGRMIAGGIQSSAVFKLSEIAVGSFSGLSVLEENRETENLGDTDSIFHR
jgi:hypothetical protein